MINQIIQPVELLADTTANDIGIKVRKSLRQLGMLHMYRREKKFYTFDVPFELMSSKDGSSIIVVIHKASLPRKFPPGQLRESRGHLEADLGMPVQIREADEVIAVSCQVPHNSQHSVAG